MKPANELCNARFWIWTVNGWVKLTIKPGESLGFSRGGPDEEGYSYTWERYSHEGAYVECEIDSDGSDCDGRYSSSAISCCEIGNLRVRDMHAEEQARAECWGDDKAKPEFNENVGVFAPEWQRVDRSVRDYAAEAMGY